ncbi:merozoite surface protein 3b [Youhaiella tibetensis]|uniref:Cell surface protein n=1 Tax=Paradevosia tibetensis TaxID=1447062 RepID=A0A5B9DI59_9HYPH|nr:cell surface protein [Youhaiella tibetensis]AKR57888.1 cell surface protein [Devosia sp. H5989]QEE18767.1 cell surface protein [Youhaiella tibetensis]GGF39366.1 merozoite surface protein 3b [Youhaiella tibetensis]
MASETTTAEQATAVTPVTEKPLQYLDKAVGAIRNLGLWPEQQQEQPITALLKEITELDETRVILIGRTLSQASAFNEVVREQVAAMNIGERYEDITKGFDSIRDDAKMLVDQLDDNKIDFRERIQNVWMKVSRGDIATRFDKIRDTYLAVSKDTKDQVDREHTILEAYRDFRGALKQSEVMALELLGIAEKKLTERKETLQKSADALSAFSEGTPAERARLELDRDEKLRDMQNEERRYQIVKDLSDNLTISYNTSEVVMARLMQTTNAKERVYQQAISFFSTNETVLTALSASFTGMFGLHEATATLDAMKEGVSKSLETLSEVGDKVQEEAVRAGYGPTVRADAVKKLVDSVVNFQEKSQTIINEMRAASTKNSAEIRDAVEDGKHRLAQLAAEGNALLLETKKA